MGTQFKKPDSRKAKARPATLTKHNFPNAVKTSQESVTSSHPPKNKSALPPLESAVIARIIFSYNNTIRNLLENDDHDSLNGKLTKPIILTADDEENNTAADSRNDRTMAPLMLETFRQLRENYHGSPSFIKQHEENIIETAHETLALFHKPPEPEQLECQSNISYTSAGNLADFEDFDKIQSYDNDDDVISHYSTVSDLDDDELDDFDDFVEIQSYDDDDDVVSHYSTISDLDDDDLDEETMATLDTLSTSVDRDTYPQNTSIGNFGMPIPSDDHVDEEIESSRTPSAEFSPPIPLPPLAATQAEIPPVQPTYDTWVCPENTHASEFSNPETKTDTTLFHPASSLPTNSLQVKDAQINQLNFQLNIIKK